MIRRIVFIVASLFPVVFLARGFAPQRRGFMDNFPGGPQAGFAQRPQMPPRLTPPAPQPVAQSPVTVAPVFVPHQNTMYEGPPPRTLVGSLCMPERIAESPSFVAFYNGLRIDITHGTYQLNDPFSSQLQLHVVFTLASVKPVSANEDDSNTIASLAFDASVPYKSFVIQRNPAYAARALLSPANREKKEQKPWLISRTELGSKKGMVVIPENALIVLISPDSITGLEQELWSDIHGNMARLPKIVLKSDIEQKTLMQLADHSAMAALDLDPFHRRPTIISEVKKELPALVVSMVTELPHERHS